MYYFFDRYKTINLVMVLLVALIWLYTIYYYSSGLCLQQECSFEFRNGLLNPVQKASFYLLPTLGLFIPLPSHYFRRWLWYIASWALPLSVYLVLSESVYTTALFSGRTFFAETTMKIFFIISVVFIVCAFAYTQYQKPKK